VRLMTIYCEQEGWFMASWIEVARIIIEHFGDDAWRRWGDLIEGKQVWCRRRWRDHNTVVIDSLSYLVEETEK